MLLNYLIVGGFVTLVDVAIYNALTRGARRMPRISANVLSTTVGMALGFTLHFALVFRPHELLLPARMAKYLVTVACSVYGVQNWVIYVLAESWRGPARLAQGFVRFVDTDRRCSEDFVDRMTGKVVASVVGMVWNFVLFKYVVYA